MSTIEIKGYSAWMNDEDRLVGAKHGYGDYPIKIWDDCGPRLWIVRNSIGIQGICRAETWEDAWGIAEDEFFPDGEEPEDEKWAAMEDREAAAHEEACWEDANGYRNNSNENGCIYAKDLNGDHLDELTPEMLQNLGITLIIEQE